MLNAWSIMYSAGFGRTVSVRLWASFISLDISSRQEYIDVMFIVDQTQILNDVKVSFQQQDTKTVGDWGDPLVALLSLPVQNRQFKDKRARE